MRNASVSVMSRVALGRDISVSVAPLTTRHTLSLEHKNLV